MPRHIRPDHEASSHAGTDHETPSQTETRSCPMAPASSAPADDATQALTILSDVVEPVGELLLVVGDPAAMQVRELAGDWARHVRSGNRGADASPDDASRDWKGLREFLTRARSIEGRAVIRSVTDLRETVQTVITGVTRSIADDRTGDREITSTLGAITDALGTDSVDQLKRTASEAVDVIGRVLKERTKRQEKQLNELDARLRAVRGELSEAKEKIARDGLTGLFNRRAFDHQLARVKRADDPGSPACLIMVDVDRFKNINDHFGHPTGDAVLTALARCLKGCFGRQEDFVARYGGEEFAVLIRTAGDDSIRLLVERVLKRVRALEVEHGSSKVRVSVSVGAAMALPGESAQTWLSRADGALYEAKRTGRDRYVIAPRPQSATGDRPA